MRLIDADELIEDIKNNLWDWETVDGITSTTVLKQTISDIKNQPSIKAIPIEWIKEWYRTNVYYLKEEKPVIYAYEQMIMDWGREDGNI